MLLILENVVDSLQRRTGDGQHQLRHEFSGGFRHFFSAGLHGACAEQGHFRSG